MRRIWFVIKNFWAPLAPMPDENPLTEEEKIILAYHEAGHAVIAYHCKNLGPVKVIGLLPVGDIIGLTYCEEKNCTIETKAKYQEEIMMRLGGLAAEKLFLRTETTLASEDLKNATALRFRMEYHYGMGKTGSIGIPFEFEDILYENFLGIIERLAEPLNNDLRYAKMILEKHRRQVEKLVEKLLEKEIISGDEFEELMRETKE